MPRTRRGNFLFFCSVVCILCLCVYVYCLLAYTVVSSAHDGLPDQLVVPIKSHLCPRAYLFCVFFLLALHPQASIRQLAIVVVASVALLTRSYFFLPGVCACLSLCLQCIYLHLNVLIIT